LGLDPRDEDGEPDAFLLDLESDTTTLLTPGIDGVRGRQWFQTPYGGGLSADGSRAVVSWFPLDDRSVSRRARTYLVSIP
jgi:hypothetical protein